MAKTSVKAPVRYTTEWERYAAEVVYAGVPAPADLSPELHHQSNLLMQAARFRLCREIPYFVAGFRSMQFVSSQKCPAIMAMDRWNRCYFRPDIVHMMPLEMVKGIVVHELLHFITRSMVRSRIKGVTADMSQWANIAMDGNINAMCREMKLALPGGCVTNASFGMRDGVTWEMGYDHLLNNLRDAERKVSAGIGFVSGAGGSSVDGHARPWEEGGEDADPDKKNENDDGNGYDFPGEIRRLGKYEQRRVLEEIAKATLEHHAKEAGTVPNELLVWANEHLRPSIVPWYRILRYQLGNIMKSGNMVSTYNVRSPRQQMYGKVVVPGRTAHTPAIGVNMDTSGSMCDGHSHSESMSEVQGILRDYSEVYLISCDADAKAAEKITNARRVKLVGGGGTNMSRGIEAFIKMKPQPRVIITMTDGYTDWPRKPPPRHITHITLMTTRDGNKPPFGMVIYMDENKAKIDDNDD